MAESAALVLIHGGQHDSRCWQPTLDVITRDAPGTHVLTVNLPGRQDVPGALDALTIADCVAAAVRPSGAAGRPRRPRRPDHRRLRCGGRRPDRAGGPG